MLSVSVAALSFAPSSVPTTGLSARVAGSPVMQSTQSTMEKFIDEFAPDTTEEKPWTSGEICDAKGLEELADKLNPILGYWDPLDIGSRRKELIGWFRHAEIKHGRVAMAAFVGYNLQLNGVHWPWNLQGLPGTGSTPISFGEISAAGGPADQWDALPSSAKLQIFLAVGFLELCSESSILLEADGQQHYVRGGKPGYFPKLSNKMPHFALDLWDPFNFNAKMSPERKEKGLLAELNNGRLAMLGIMGLVSVSKGLIVPGLDSLNIPAYKGEIMAPFSDINADLPLISTMLTARAEQIAREIAILGDAYPGA